MNMEFMVLHYWNEHAGNNGDSIPVAIIIHEKDNFNDENNFIRMIELDYEDSVRKYDYSTEINDVNSKISKVKDVLLEVVDERGLENFNLNDFGYNYIDDLMFTDVANSGFEYDSDSFIDLLTNTYTGETFDS